MKAIDHTGKTYGRLTVTGPHVSKGYWLADCFCGTKDNIVRGSSLASGNTKSCGCLRLLNKGRPRLPGNAPHIPFDVMLDATFVHLNPIRHFLKSQGVTVTKNGFVFINGRKFGPYKSPYHALAAAIDKAVMGVNES